MPAKTDSRSAKTATDAPHHAAGRWRSFGQGFSALLGLCVAGVVALCFAVATAMAVAYPNLPDVSALADYQPKLPLRVLTADQQLIGEFGEERRQFVPISEIPEVVKLAVLAIEDARFFEHGGVDYRGMARAVLANFGQAKSQGASTITMQVARNVYLSAEKSYTRKIYEILLTFKLEYLLSKEQILEIYMNQIFLGQRAYGFAAASQTYFGKPLQSLTVAEAAMLAGLPKAPSAFNPIANPKRARTRQLHIIDRMLENGFIDAEEARLAKIEPLTLRPVGHTAPRVHAEFVAEMVRQAMFEQYGEAAYHRGLVVTTSVVASEQQAAYSALRAGVLSYEARQRYRGPEAFAKLPEEVTAREEIIDNLLTEFPDHGNLLSAVVLEAGPRSVKAVRMDGAPFTIAADGLRSVQSGLAANAPPAVKIRPGAVIRVVQAASGAWRITQLPEVEAAFVSLDPSTGLIHSLVGGFDFQKNKFNHVTQAWRQPGSSFKPFVYSAALEKGLTPTTVVNDAPLFFSARETGGKAWEPKNYDGQFEGPMSVRRALAKSKNMVSIQVLQLVGAQSTQAWVSRFGFPPERHPAYLTMALGAGSVTPMQMAVGYGVFANGGHRVSPTLITRVVEQKGRVLYERQASNTPTPPRVISERNAFLMSSLLQEITRSGTAARAQSTLKRPDLYGKTGTTNDSVDAWFVGYQPSRVAAAWVGYDTPRNLGSRETGGGLSLPIWIDYMKTALVGVPVVSYAAPDGVIRVGGDWYFEEYGPDRGVQGIGLQETLADTESGLATPESPTPMNRRDILDLFRN